MKTWETTKLAAPDYAPKFGVYDEDQDLIAVVSGSDPEKVKGNAQLIAAAPELLEALKAARETIRAWHGPNAWDIYDRASPEMKAINSAIAKAEGRS